MDIKNFLDRCKLGHLFGKFEEQKIDEIEILNYLTEEEINCLTDHSIGDKIKLKRAIKALNTNEDNVDNSLEIPSTSFSKNSEENPTKKIRSEPLTEATDDESKTLMTISEATGIRDITNLPIYILNAPEEDQSFATETLTYETSGYVSGGKAPSTSSSNHTQESREETSGFSSLANFELLSFLKDDIIGNALLQKSQRESLTNNDRDRLSEILIKYLMNKHGKLCNEDLKILANKIEKYIPNEKSSTYYIPPIPKNRSLRNISERSRGKLTDKQRNLLWLINSLNKKEKTAELASMTADDKKTEDIPQEARDSQIWLKQNEEPPSEVVRHWKNSYCVRKLESAETIEDFIEKWPILKNALAPELVTLDFQRIHPQPKNFNLEDVFQQFFEVVLASRRNSLSTTDNTLLELLSGELTTDSRTALQLYLLPALIPPKGRVQAGKSNWKPSVSEARDALLIHVKIPGDVEEAKKNQVDCMFKKGLTVQPYLLLIGQSLSNISGSLVIVNNHEYKCLSVLDALDFCFKSYQILDAKYPFQCSHIWYLFQWRLYKYFTKFDPQIPHINDLL